MLNNILKMPNTILPYFISEKNGIVNIKMGGYPYEATRLNIKSALEIRSKLNQEIKRLNYNDDPFIILRVLEQKGGHYVLLVNTEDIKPKTDKVYIQSVFGRYLEVVTDKLYAKQFDKQDYEFFNKVISQYNCESKQRISIEDGGYLSIDYSLFKKHLQISI